MNKKNIEYFHGKNELWVGNVSDEKLLEYILLNNLSNDCTIKFNIIGDVPVGTVADVKAAFVVNSKNDKKNDN